MQQCQDSVSGWWIPNPLYFLPCGWDEGPQPFLVPVGLVSVPGGDGVISPSLGKAFLEPAPHVHAHPMVDAGDGAKICPWVEGGGVTQPPWEK